MAIEKSYHIVWHPLFPAGYRLHEKRIVRTMNNELYGKVDQLLHQGLNRHQVWSKLKQDEDQDDLCHYLNTTALPQHRKKYLVLNIILAGVLSFMTCKKILIALALGLKGLFLVLAMVVPLVNIYVLFRLMRFKRAGYQYLFVLSCLSLFQVENRFLQEWTMLAVMIVLSGFLYLKMFSKKELINENEVEESNVPA